MTYQVVAARWHDFYVLAGTSAATLAGLLFVGLSLHLRVVIAHAEVRGLARITLANLGLVLVLSLFLVIDQGSTAASLEMIFSGAVSLAVVAPSVIRAARARSSLPNRAQLVSRFVLSLTGYAGTIVAGVLERTSASSTAFAWLVVVTILLVVVSLRSSWDLLVRVGEMPPGSSAPGGA